MRRCAARRRTPWKTTAALLFVVANAGCAQRERADETSQRRPMPQPAPQPECSCGPGAAVAPLVDPTLLAFLSKARSIHHEADLAEHAGDGAGAVALLEQLTNGP